MLSQLIFNLSLKVCSFPNSFFKKILFILVRFLINIRIIFNDPAVQYTFLGYKIKIPLSHNFPLAKETLSFYGKNLSFIAKFVSEKYPDTPIIDVGANVGDSVVWIRKESNSPILAIEGNKKFIKYLEINTQQFKNIQIAPFFVNEISGRATPVNYAGSSYINLTDQGDIVMPLDRIIEKFANFKNSKFLKVDTDGFDNKVIRSSNQLLTSNKPVIFFEYDPYLLSVQGEKNVEIFDFLYQHGYELAIIFDNIGRLLCCLSLKHDLQILNFFDKYFNQNSTCFIDICVLTNHDHDIAEKIINEYIIQ